MSRSGKIGSVPLIRVNSLVNPVPAPSGGTGPLVLVCISHFDWLSGVHTIKARPLYRMTLPDALGFLDALGLCAGAAPADARFVLYSFSMAMQPLRFPVGSQELCSGP